MNEIDSLFPSEKQIQESVKNSNEINLIKDYFKQVTGRENIPEDVFNYMLELYKDLPFILQSQNKFRRKKFVIRRTIEYIIDNFSCL